VNSPSDLIEELMSRISCVNSALIGIATSLPGSRRATASEVHAPSMNCFMMKLTRMSVMAFLLPLVMTSVPRGLAAYQSRNTGNT
jgi:hypothetical protein